MCMYEKADILFISSCCLELTIWYSHSFISIFSYESKCVLSDSSHAKNKKSLKVKHFDTFTVLLSIVFLLFPLIYFLLFLLL